MIKKIIIYSFIPILFFVGCRKEYNPSYFLRIEYGTSFGECMGYCKHDISITSDKIVFTKSGWIDSLVSRQCNREISLSDFKTLTEEINVTRFQRLGEVIGCPDCTDGGAEWIRIVTEHSDQKVTFEYGNEPDAVKPFIEKLRTYLKEFENCN